MNIVFLTREYPPDTLWGGAGRFNHSLACALARRGHIVHVIAQAVTRTRTEVDAGVFVHRVGTDPRRYSVKARMNYFFHSLREFVELRTREPIDVVQADYWSADGLFLALRRDKPFVLWSQSSPLDAIRSKSYKGVVQLISLLALQGLADFTAKRAAMVVADSRANYRDCVRRLHLNPAKCTVVHPGVDTDRFKFVRSKIKDTIGIPDRYPTALFVGRLEPRKGVEVLLRAIPKIVKCVPEVRFLIAGQDTGFSPHGGSAYEHFAHEARARGFAGNLVRLGFVPEDMLVQLYSACDVLIFPSLHESFGFPVIEAMACGRPVVATTTGIAPEVGFDGRCGSIVSVGDDDALAREAVKYLLLGPEEKAAIAEKNSNTVRLEFSVEVWAGKMEDVYKFALSLARAEQSLASIL